MIKLFFFWLPIIVFVVFIYLIFIKEDENE